MRRRQRETLRATAKTEYEQLKQSKWRLQNTPALQWVAADGAHTLLESSGGVEGGADQAICQKLV